MQDLASFEGMGSAATEIERLIILCDCGYRQHVHIEDAGNSGHRVFDMKPLADHDGDTRVRDVEARLK